MYDDPRTVDSVDQHENLTEDSDDALADLEKEFAVKRQKLIEERARKRERAQKTLQVERSPSPKRKKPENHVKLEYFKREGNSNYSGSNFGVAPSRPGSVNPAKDFKNASAPNNDFASRLFKHETGKPKVNYGERIFEFQSIPPKQQIEINEENAVDFISGERLRRRYIEVSEATRLVKDVKILRISKLLAKVYGPKYEEPPYANWCFAGVINYKSEPKTAVNGKKYLTLRVGNFNHTVDITLFGEAFTRFWKLSCGEVIVILNPTIKKYGSGFSLSLQDDDINSILEIGDSRYYGHCSAKNKQNEQCKYVVDLSKNDLCSFHEEAKFKQGSRMELQGSVKPKAPINKQGHTSQAFMGAKSGQPSFVQYINAGFSEKDHVYAGGEQFRHDKYDRPVKDTEAAKLRKRMANERLRTQLIISAPPNRLNDLDKLGIVKQNQSEIIERQQSLQKIRSQAFKSTFLNGMGYDPTAEKTQHSERRRPTRSMEELRSISKTKNVSLKPSEEDQRKKSQKQKSVLRIIKSGNPAVALSKGPAVPKSGAAAAGSPMRSPPKIPTVSDEERDMLACDISCADNADSDSDLEIAFACDADLLRYKTAISVPESKTKSGEKSTFPSKLSQEAQT